MSNTWLSELQIKHILQEPLPNATSIHWFKSMAQFPEQETPECKTLFTKEHRISEKEK